jgi:hypothetical protein
MTARLGRSLHNSTAFTTWNSQIITIIIINAIQDNNNGSLSFRSSSSSSKVSQSLTLPRSEVSVLQCAKLQWYPPPKPTQVPNPNPKSSILYSITPEQHKKIHRKVSIVIPKSLSQPKKYGSEEGRKKRQKEYPTPPLTLNCRAQNNKTKRQNRKKKTSQKGTVR